MSGREADSRGLVIAKDILTATMVAAGVSAMIVSKRVSTAPQAEYETDPTNGTQTIQPAQWFVATMGTVNLAAAAGIICLTALLNMRAGARPAGRSCRASCPRTSLTAQSRGSSVGVVA